MKVERRIHTGYKEYQDIVKKLPDYKMPFKQYFGKYQYIYTQNKKVISLVKLKGLNNEWFWEIYCLKGNLFDDVCRFPTKKEGVKRIVEIFARRK